MLSWISLLALVVVAILGWNLFKRFATDRIEAIEAKHRPTSRMVSRAEFVEGNRHFDVALALTQSTLYYENSDIQASLDLRWVREIEYDSELATGLAVAGRKVMRLRTDSQMFEFVIPNDVVARWHMMLPARRAMSPVVAVAEPQAVTP